MNALRRQFLVPIVLALAAAAPAQIEPTASSVAEPEYFGYLQIPGITGSVTSPRAYAGWFRIESYALAEAATFPAGGGGSVQVSASTLVVTGEFALATPQLMMDTFTSPRYATVTLHVFRDVVNPTQVAEIVLNNAQLVDLGSGGETLTGSRLEFVYERVTWTWILPGGNRTTTLDLRTSGVPLYRETTAPIVASPRESYVALLHVPGVRGGSTRPGHLDWIDVSDVVSGIHRTDPTAPLASTPTVGANAYLGPGLPDLARLAALGTVHPTVDLHVFRSASDIQPILELVLTAAGITSLVHHAQPGGAGIHVEFTMERIQWTYVDPVSGVRTTRCWNLTTRAPC